MRPGCANKSVATRRDNFLAVEFGAREGVAWNLPTSCVRSRTERLTEVLIFMIRSLVKLLSTSVLLGFGALAACSSEHQSQHANTPADAVQGTSASAETRSAAESIAEARCVREQRCDNVGENKKYSAMSDCLTRIRADWKDDLNARECPGGVKRAELDECLNKIRAEDCGSPFDTLARVTECTAGQICSG